MSGTGSTEEYERKLALNPSAVMKARHRFHLWRANSRLPLLWRIGAADAVWVSGCACCCIWCEEPIQHLLYRWFTFLSTAGAERLFKEK